MSMKNSYRVKKTGREKAKNTKKALRISAPTNIAQRYMELRRLRAQISEAEASMNPS
jgi:hypothetical protein